VARTILDAQRISESRNSTEAQQIALDLVNFALRAKQSGSRRSVFFWRLFEKLGVGCEKEMRVLKAQHAVFDQRVYADVKVDAQCDREDVDAGHIGYAAFATQESTSLSSDAVPFEGVFSSCIFAVNMMLARFLMLYVRWCAHILVPVHVCVSVCTYAHFCMCAGVYAWKCICMCACVFLCVCQAFGWSVGYQRAVLE
jgi:hypothetical protein